MKYFCTETERKASKGTLVAAIPQFDPFGITEVTMEQWQQVKSRTEAIGGETRVAVMEIEDWVRKCFEEEEVFTICGI